MSNQKHVYSDDSTLLELLSILKAVIHSLPMDVSSSVDWDAVMKLAARHQVLPLVFEKASEDHRYR